LQALLQSEALSDVQKTTLSPDTAWTRYLDRIAAKHSSPGVQHDDRSTVLHFDDDLGAAYAPAGKAGDAVAGGVMEHVIEGGARHVIQRALPIE
jgi:hypothetical protein